ncbi:type I-E CRISPR-associated protein Cse2/CasB [Kutzneria sp. NPDC052558]|uniref:type I-E CRISPR-associated protein Cse2/CasB n=1 Tax=Kutzneria sp. NPDC052558 TaxID=3364121 RepID=UPI0037C9A453
MTTKGQAVPEDAAPTTKPSLSAAAFVVHSRIRVLQEGALANRGAQVAGLARLRRAAGKRPGEITDIFEHTTAAEFTPRSEDRASDEPTAQETAAHIALTLYATHQQSQSERMHQLGPGMGKALRQLLPDGLPEEKIHPVQRRFQALGGVDDVHALAVQLRGLVQLLRAQHICLDYAQLTDELIRWQSDPLGPSKVRLRWGRDFYRATPKKAPTASAQA